MKGGIKMTSSPLPNKLLSKSPALLGVKKTIFLDKNYNQKGTRKIAPWKIATYPNPNYNPGGNLLGDNLPGGQFSGQDSEPYQTQLIEVFLKYV